MTGYWPVNPLDFPACYAFFSSPEYTNYVGFVNSALWYYDTQLITHYNTFLSAGYEPQSALAAAGDLATYEAKLYLESLNYNDALYLALAQSCYVEEFGNSPWALFNWQSENMYFYALQGYLLYKHDNINGWSGFPFIQDTMYEWDQCLKYIDTSYSYFNWWPDQATCSAGWDINMEWCDWNYTQNPVDASHFYELWAGVTCTLDNLNQYICSDGVNSQSFSFFGTLPGN